MMKNLIHSVIIMSFLVWGNMAIAATCSQEVINMLENTSSQGPDGEYYIKPIRVADGDCQGGCPQQLNYNESVTFISNGQNWSTVLTGSVYQSSSVNTGSFRVEIQNANTTCKPVNVYSDYCSTDPSSGKANCSYVGVPQSDGSLKLEIKMQ